MEVLDEEFLHHLNRGADLLGNGDAAAAASALERARELRPGDAQVLGLLGQALYALGQFERATEVYQRLVDVSPAEAAARLNLGLANLKARRYPQAIRQLEIALDLSPEHKRAMGYLGLAWLEQGEWARARAWFERAGSTQMVARCDELIAAAGTSPERAGPEQAQPPSTSPAIVLDVPRPGVVPGEASDGEPGLVAEVAPRRGRPFALDGGLLTVSIRDPVLARAEGLVAVQGGVRLVPEMKRFGGNATEKPFGDGARRVLRASGDGALVYAVGTRRVVRVELEDETGYFREEAVFAFEGRLAFENGRIAPRSGAGTGVELVQLRGRGQVLLASTAPVVALRVTTDAPLRIGIAALVGWVGALAPQFVALPGDREPRGDVAGDLRAMELTGTGRALLEGAAG